MTADQLRVLMEGPTGNAKRIAARDAFLKTAADVVTGEGFATTHDRIRLALAGFYNGMRFTEGLRNAERERLWDAIQWLQANGSEALVASAFEATKKP